MIGIYKIINPKGKVYVGQTTNIKKREKTYSRLNCKKQPKLYNSLKKYGYENHTFEIIEECTLEQLNEREIYWGLYFDVLGKKGLNLKLGNGRGSCSEETKQKMRGAAFGRTWSDDSKKKFKLSKTNHSMYNDEWRNKIKEANKGRKILWADKISNSSKGLKGKFTNKSHSEETKKKMSEYRKEYYSNDHKKTQVLQYDLEGNFIKEWNSIVEAKKEFKGDISACVRGRQKTSCGYIWKVKE
jgi:group I intron endonuclease